MICLEMKLIPIIMTQLGMVLKPHMRYPKGWRRPNLDMMPSKGCRMPVYSSFSRYRDLEFEGIDTMSAIVVVVRLSGMMWRGTLGAGFD